MTGFSLHLAWKITFSVFSWLPNSDWLSVMSIIVLRAVSCFKVEFEGIFIDMHLCYHCQSKAGLWAVLDLQYIFLRQRGSGGESA